MQYTTNGLLAPTPPMTSLCPGFSRQPYLRLEDDAPEETRIRELELEIGKARRNRAPVDSLIEQRRLEYESWIKRLDREIDREKTEYRRKIIEQQRERAIRDYKWPDS
jgi:hypothetical protein